MSTGLDDAAYRALVGRVLAESGVCPEVAGLPAGAEAVRRRAEDGRSWLFVINNTDEQVHVSVAGRDLLAARAVPPEGLTVPAGGVAVVREE